MNNYIFNENHINLTRKQKIYKTALEYPFAVMRHQGEDRDNSSICLIRFIKGRE